MPEPLEDTRLVADFMHTFGQDVRDHPTADITVEERLLRASLVLEEAMEFVAAMGCRMGFRPGPESGQVVVDIAIDPERDIDLVEATDAMADLIVVVKGSAHTLGVDIDEATRIVHATNMAKAPGGVVLRREDGKVLKPEGWQPPTEALRALVTP